MSSDKSSASKAWQHVDGPSEEERKRNRFLNPKDSELPPKIKTLSIDAPSGFLKLENISCYNNRGGITERYPLLYVARDVFRETDGKNKGQPVNFNQNEAILRCESDGLLLPSMALTCAIVARLFEKKDDPDTKAVLDQYFVLGKYDVLHVQNTLIIPSVGKVIHYNTSNVAGFGGYANLGMSSIELGFSFEFPCSSLEIALKNPKSKKAIRNLTGLKDPGQLIDIGNYFRRETTCFERCIDRCLTTALGCDNSGLLLFADYLGCPAFLARGVKIGGDAK